MNYKNFMGSEAFVVIKPNNLSRKKLPYLRPPNEKINMWSVLGKLFGQDLTKISLPVIISEPLSTLQKTCESTNIHEDLVAKAAQQNDSLKRLGQTIGHFIAQFNITKNRSKKPFNPMLGETYELVTEDFRFIAEQVCHHPPISAYYQEGKNYKINGFYDTKSSFGFGGGKGVMVVKCLG